MTDGASPERLARPGQTCWRIARAEKVAIIPDAAAYFAAARAAILSARHSVFLIGWDFDWSIRLEREGADDGAPSELGAFLTHVVETRPDLRIRVLRWDLSFLKFPFRATVPMKALDWVSGRRLDLRADHEHPLGACHHQKIVVVDDCLAFCGGIDMTLYRWDTPAHADGDPRRRDRGQAYGPWHDVTTCLTGNAAAALGDLARARWRRATGEAIPPTPTVDPCWPAGLSCDLEDVDVAIARTEPSPREGEPAVREIEALTLAAIAAARRSIYIETQYLASFRIARALAARLRDAEGPDVVVVVPESAAGWLEEAAMGSARALLVRLLRCADRHGRFRLYTPVTTAGEAIYVHAKVMVVDDRLLRIGSSNVNNRSLGLDTECDLVIEASNQAEAQAIRGIRDRLIEEHLDRPAGSFREDLARAGGSLAGAIEAARQPAGRRLAPFTPPRIGAAQAALARSQLLDPDRPETLAPAFVRGTVPGPISARGAAWLLAGACLAGLAAYVARTRTPIARRLRGGRPGGAEARPPRSARRPPASR